MAASLLHSIDLSIKSLGETKDSLEALTIIPPNKPIRRCSLKSILAVFGPRQCGIIDNFLAAGLISQVADDIVVIHPLISEYLQRTVDNVQDNHRKLVDYYRHKCGGIWSKGPDDGYFFENLPYHLYGANLNSQAAELWYDLDWLEAHRLAVGINTPKKRRCVTGIFLCHAKEDKNVVRSIYRALKSDGFAPWMDEFDLHPGQEWEVEIQKAIRNCGLFLAFLSAVSVSKRGYVQKEFKFAWNRLQEMPEGAIYLIPVKLTNCAVPMKFEKLQWLELANHDQLEPLMSTLDFALDGLA